MKEHITDYYFDAYYIILEKHYRTWDPHLCHWRIFDWSLEACMHLENGGNGLITFSIFMRVCQMDAKGQIIAKKENYKFPRLGVKAFGFGIRGTINDV